MLGTYALSAGYYDAYYLRAQKVRTLVRRDFDQAFERCDVVAGPVSPTRRPSGSARRSATRCRCTWPTSSPSPATWRRCPGSRCPAGCTRSRAAGRAAAGRAPLRRGRRCCAPPGRWSGSWARRPPRRPPDERAHPQRGGAWCGAAMLVDARCSSPAVTAGRWRRPATCGRPSSPGCFFWMAAAVVGARDRALPRRCPPRIRPRAQGPRDTAGLHPAGRAPGRILRGGGHVPAGGQLVTGDPLPATCVSARGPGWRWSPSSRPRRAGAPLAVQPLESPAPAGWMRW